MTPRKLALLRSAPLMTLLLAAWPWTCIQGLRPECGHATNAALRQEMNQLTEAVRSRPWFTAWAPALRHEAVSDELIRRLKSETRSRDDARCCAPCRPQPAIYTRTLELHSCATALYGASPINSNGTSRRIIELPGISGEIASVRHESGSAPIRFPSS